jgi:hypothetical protein
MAEQASQPTARPSTNAPAPQQQQQQTRRRRKSTASGEVPVSKADVETAVAAARSERRDVASAQGTKTEVDPDNSL